MYWWRTPATCTWLSLSQNRRRYVTAARSFINSSCQEVVSSSKLSFEFVGLIGTLPFRLITLCLHTFILYQQVEAIKTKVCSLPLLRTPNRLVLFHSSFRTGLFFCVPFSREHIILLLSSETRLTRLLWWSSSSGTSAPWNSFSFKFYPDAFFQKGIYICRIYGWPRRLFWRPPEAEYGGRIIAANWHKYICSVSVFAIYAGLWPQVCLTWSFPP